MQIDLQARGFELTAGLRDHTYRKLKFATDWAQDEVRSVKIRLSDVNGPRGGEDKRCLVQIPLHGQPAIVIENTASDMYAAISQAIGRAEQILAKRVDRKRECPHTTRAARGEYFADQTSPLASE